MILKLLSDLLYRYPIVRKPYSFKYKTSTKHYQNPACSDTRNRAGCPMFWNSQPQI